MDDAKAEKDLKTHRGEPSMCVRIACYCLLLKG
jgi:hypothetical protein